jgi:hypothetical protein
MTSIGMHFGSDSDDPETQIAAGALGRLFRERQLDRYRMWLTARANYPKSWRDAAIEDEHLIYLTPEEMEQLHEELHTVLLPRFRERLTDPPQRPAGSAPVELLLFAYPIEPPTPAD